MAFVMAAAASAVGLGNLWRFPYLAAKYGGGIFLAVYAILAVTVGFALMTVEIAIGRRTKLSPPDAFRSVSRKWEFVGWLGMAVPTVILAYYNVIGGWIVKYLAFYARRLLCEESAAAAMDAGRAQAVFDGFVSGGSLQPFACGAVFAGCTAILVLLGVKRGIERSSKILMPLLLLLCVAVAAISLSQPGAGAGVKYYLKPDFAAVSWKTVVWALGQVFFSLSLAMGIMITYGSYMHRNESIPKCVLRIEFFDALVAVLAGLIVIPPVFAFLGEEGLKEQGPGLMFVALPVVFSRMTLFGFGIGDLAGLLFFALAFFAAVTSSVSVMETVVSSLRDRTGMRRTPAGLAVTAYMFALLLPVSMCYAKDGPMAGISISEMPLLDFMDFISNNIMMPVCAFCTCIFAGWAVGPGWIYAETRHGGTPLPFARAFAFMVKYAAPVAIIVIFAACILKELEVVSM